MFSPVKIRWLATRSKDLAVLVSMYGWHCAGTSVCLHLLRFFQLALTVPRIDLSHCLPLPIYSDLFPLVCLFCLFVCLFVCLFFVLCRHEAIYFWQGKGSFFSFDPFLAASSWASLHGAVLRTVSCVRCLLAFLLLHGFCSYKVIKAGVWHFVSLYPVCTCAILL